MYTIAGSWVFCFSISYLDEYGVFMIIFSQFVHVNPLGGRLVFVGINLHVYIKYEGFTIKTVMNRSGRLPD